MLVSIGSLTGRRFKNGIFADGREREKRCELMDLSISLLGHDELYCGWSFQSGATYFK
jgi:hypothetical protein